MIHDRYTLTLSGRHWVSQLWIRKSFLMERYPNSDSIAVPEMPVSWLFWEDLPQKMRKRHASGSRFYTTVFSVDSFIYQEAISFSHYLVDFSLGHLQQLSKTPFVPVESTGYKGDIKRLQPTRCFLGKPRSELHSKLFAFVDFGVRANQFLKCCFTSEEPSVEDIAQVLLEDPQRVYDFANGREK
jgi:Protein of unknown function (DUF3684)